ncbi:polycomb protein Scm [Anastrepha obliqua]|uniref:polycomb protein Scm n=1 Tax=Anastrepha obliqua TaxID=95512 RepID=UPI002409F7AE|nr:polycomb protein Scm [Anastrepha obliqua]
MGTLHVCFADLPHYKSATSAIAASSLTTLSQTGALAELSAAMDTANCTTTMTEQTELSKDMPPCSLSPGANSAHSTSPTPRYERNMSFFHQLSRRFGLLRSSDDPVFSAAEDDSTDSCSSTTGAIMSMQRSIGVSATSSLCAPNGENTVSSSRNNNHETHLQTSTACMKDSQGSSSEHISCASSETSSTTDMEEPQEQQTHSPTATAKLPTLKERPLSARANLSRFHRRSTSSIRRAFESFSLSTRSLSCGGATSNITPLAAEHTQCTTNNSNTTIKSVLKYNSNIELNRKSQTGGGGCNTSYSASSLHFSSASNKTAASATLKSSKGKTKPPPQRILRQPISYTYLKGISGLPTQRVPRSAVCCQYARR